MAALTPTRPAARSDATRRRTELALIVAALTGCVLALVLAGGWWRARPVTFAAIGLGMGALWLAALRAARGLTASSIGCALVLVGSLAINAAALGLRPSDDTARCLVEGVQVAAGQNPYAVPPADPAARALVPAQVADEVNHAGMTAIYPPLGVMLDAVLAALWPSQRCWQIAGLVAALVTAACWCVIARRAAAPLSAVIAVAWHPLWPLWLCGEGHLDASMAALLAVALALRPRMAAIAVATAAVLVKPFALAALPPLVAGRWRLLAPSAIIAVAAWIPFADAGGGLVRSLLAFGGTMHFHGVLEPPLRRLATPLLPAPLVQPLITVALALALLAGCVLVWRRRAPGAAPAALGLRLAIIGLCCLPTLHPWYLAIVMVLLPAAMPWQVAVWTAAAPLYWLHGVAIADAGAWIEDARVTTAAAFAALPALAWACGRGRQPVGRDVQGPVRIGQALPSTSGHPA